MDVLGNVPVDVALDREFDEAFELLNGLVDWRQADELMPLGPAAIYTASVVLWMLVYQRMHAGASLQAAVKHLIEAPPEHCPQNKRLREKTISGNTAAFSQARQRLTPEVTQWFASRVCDSLIAASPPSWQGRRVYLIDGTTITLAPEPELQKAFPPASNQHGEGVWPVALLLVAHELASGCALLPEIGPMYGPLAIAETALVPACVQRLPSASIIMGDANFGIFAVAHAAAQAGHDFLLRMTAPRFHALARKAQLTKQGAGWKTYSHQWTPSAKERKTHPGLPADAHLAVRLHEIEIHETLTLWLVSGLPDSAVKLSGLYRKREYVETDLRNLKVVLDTEHIRARSLKMFHKELQTSMVAYNLVVQFRRQAADLARLTPRQLSFTGVWTTFRQFLMNRLHTDPMTWRESYRRALSYAMRDKLPHRPGRSYPRTAYPKRHKSSQFAKREKPQKTDNPDDESTK
ncbi:MAG TPA: IS4 family transposase [Geobacterales bacterium]|nr:IS4 family transposase [Geobacterales bacterium]